MPSSRSVTQFTLTIAEEEALDPFEGDGIRFGVGTHFEAEGAEEHKPQAVPFFKPPYQFYKPEFKDPGDIKSLVIMIDRLTAHQANPLEGQERQAFMVPDVPKGKKPEKKEAFSPDVAIEDMVSYFSRISQQVGRGGPGRNSLVQKPSKRFNISKGLEPTRSLEAYLSAKNRIWLEVDVKLNSKIQGTILMRQVGGKHTGLPLGYEVKAGQYLVLRRHPFADALKNQELSSVYLLHQQPQNRELKVVPGFKKGNAVICGDYLGLFRQLSFWTQHLNLTGEAGFSFSAVLAEVKKGKIPLELKDAIILIGKDRYASGSLAFYGGEMEVDLFLKTSGRGPFEGGFYVQGTYDDIHGEAVIRIKIENMMGRAKALLNFGEVEITSLEPDGLVFLEGPVNRFAALGVEALLGDAIVYPGFEAGQGWVCSDVAGYEVDAEADALLTDLGSSSFGGKAGENWLRDQFESAARYFLEAGNALLEVGEQWWNAQFDQSHLAAPENPADAEDSVG